MSIERIVKNHFAAERRKLLKKYTRIRVLSIKPKYAKMIYDGRKTWEFRKVAPPIGEPIYIYESAPVSAVTGVLAFCFEVRGWAADVYYMALTNKVYTKNLPGITNDELYDYVGKSRLVSALRILEAKRLKDPFLLPKPPQNWGCVYFEKGDAE